MTNPLITIAMPIYNVAFYVKASLLSALNQTFRSLEILVVDDKGQDNSMEVIHSIITTHPRGNIVRIIDHGINRHTGATKNSAIDNARGKFIYFMDSDDILMPECIQILFDVMQKHRVDVVFAAHGQYLESNLHKPVDVFPVADCVMRGKQAILKYTKQAVREKYMVGTVNKLYDMDFIRKHTIRCIPHHLQEDPWFSFQVCLYAESFVGVSTETYKQIIHEDSQSHVALGVFHKQQNHEICEAEKEVMRRYQCVPKGVMDLYCSRLKVLIPLVRGSKYSIKEMKEMILDYTNLYGIKFRYSDIYGFNNKLLVMAYQTRNYDIIRHIHTLLIKIKKIV